MNKNFSQIVQYSEKLDQNNTEMHKRLEQINTALDNLIELLEQVITVPKSTRNLNLNKSLVNPQLKFSTQNLSLQSPNLDLEINLSRFDANELSINDNKSPMSFNPPQSQTKSKKSKGPKEDKPVPTMQINLGNKQ